MTHLKRLFVGAAATFFVVAAFAAEPTRTLVSTDGVKVELPGSKAWVQSKDPAPDGTTVVFGTSDASAMQALISPGPRMPAAELTDEKLQEIMTRMTAGIAEQAVEKDLSPKALGEGANRGLYVTATDKAPKAGEFKYVTMILVVVGDIPVVTTILFNDAGKADESQLRAAAANMKVSLPAQ